jgi:DNA primase
MFSSNSLQQLRDKIDLIEVIERFVPLKRMGASYKACCPFHEEKTPSFVLKRGDSHYHCFGCGAHGDAISFLMEHEHISFSEAVETLAELFHVPLEKEEKNSEELAPTEIKKALEIANHFYRFYLKNHPEGHKALEYLFKRRLSLDFIDRYQLGFAPAKEGLFLKRMEHHKISKQVLVQAGLLNSAGRDFFQNRITFPVNSPRGALVGFSARKIHEETFGGKYINSPETLVFKKSKILYGLHLSRRSIAKQQKVIVVEGQIDCLRLIDAGWDLTVASLGTAFGVSHVSELALLGVKEACLLFDGDKAGKEAASKVGDLFQSVGIDVKVARLPDQEDPDSFLKTRGASGLKTLLETAVPYLVYQMDYMQEQAGPVSPATTHQIVSALTKQIKNWKEPIMVHESLKMLAKLTHVPETIIGVTAAPTLPVVKNKWVEKGIHIDPDKILEQDLLRWLVLFADLRPDFLKTALHYLTPDFFRKEDCKKLFQAFLSGITDRLQLGLVAPDLMDEILKKRVNRDRADSHFLQSVQKIVDRQWLQDRERIKQAIHCGQHNDEQVLALAKSFDELGRQRKTIVLIA